jgi:molecular chaperone GrpE (heat shock protein)
MDEETSINEDEAAQRPSQAQHPLSPVIDKRRASAGMRARIRGLLGSGAGRSGAPHAQVPAPAAASDPQGAVDQIGWEPAQYEALAIRCDHLCDLIAEHLARHSTPGPLDEATTVLVHPLEERLDTLTQLFQAKILDDESKAELLRKLYEDLARYRDDFLFNHLIAGIFDDLIRLDDRLDDTLAPETVESLNRADLIDRLTRFQGQVQKVLRLHGVEIVSSTDGSFDPAIQEAVDAVPVATTEDDQRVLRVRRRGYAYRGRVLRPEKVVVGRYEAVEEQTNG